MTVCFVELEAFTEEVLRVADEETLRQFEAELAARPEAGDLIRHSGGLRKARMKLPGRGKSAGARVITFGCRKRGALCCSCSTRRRSRRTSRPLCWPITAKWLK